jgi:hypothetical protein
MLFVGQVSWLTSLHMTRRGSKEKREEERVKDKVCYYISIKAP